jgi:hypothetical protein
MRQRMARHTPHKPFALLCVEPLEDRCLLSGFTSLPSAHPPTPSESGPALLAHRHPGGAGKDSPTPGHQPKGAAAGLVQDEGAQAATWASSASRVGAAHEAPGHHRTAHLADPDRNHETKQTEHHPASHHHTSSPRADHAGQAHGNGGHKADQSDDLHSAPVGHKHTTVENNHSGRGADGSNQDDDSLADLPRDSGGDLTETDNAAEARTTAASHRGSAAGLTVAVHDLLAQASVAYWSQLGPFESAGASAQEGPFQILRELHDARAERSDSPGAEPAREAAAAELAAVAFAGQAGPAAAVPHGATVDADRQAAAFKLMFLAPANTRPGAWRWGASGDWLNFAALGDEGAPQPRAYRPAVAAPPADPTGNATEAPDALPQGAGLAAGFLPADTAALEQAVRRFLDGLNTLHDLTRALTENTWVRWAVIAAVAALAAEVGRRSVLQRSSRQSASAEEDESATVSWLAGSYPFRPEDD